MGRSAEDLTNQKFGKLTVIRRATEEEWPRGSGRHAKWLCLCECGKYSLVQSGDLKKKNGTSSCGCIGKEKAVKLAHDLGVKNFKDLTGEKFGKLTVIKRAYKENNNSRKVFWLCQCECGNYTNVTTENLTTGHTKSCGCLRNINHSQGEEKIEKLLNSANISFVREKTFEDLHGKCGTYLRFDFYIPDQKIVLEFNGEGHYQLVKRFHSNRKEFLSAQERDRKKISYCLAHGIYIYCIPYWEIGKIERAEDLFQNKFLAKTKWKNDEDWKRHQS